MDGNFEPIPVLLAQRILVLTHDLRKLRENVAAGRVRPEHYAAIEQVLGARLAGLEAEVHARLLEEQTGRRARWN
jgi:hypothetical protein